MCKIVSIDELERGDYIVHFFIDKATRMKGHSRSADSLTKGREIGQVIGVKIGAMFFSVDRRIDLVRLE